eukprot:Gregarina_sp_Poly_1__7273@NODE_39_length_18147_cov_101_572069_g34_i0_p16_GENE_NODE_39_length_18147_cov_101_572069_g34_i0NODE_39_length_18147_cov_101_572069_g34_i0_p16_ORF_typecomplete_len145_score17_64_NODE_39_length_18147_cov_101_572069_g34_i01507915513
MMSSLHSKSSSVGTQQFASSGPLAINDHDKPDSPSVPCPQDDSFLVKTDPLPEPQTVLYADSNSCHAVVKSLRDSVLTLDSIKHACAMASPGGTLAAHSPSLSSDSPGILRTPLVPKLSLDVVMPSGWLSGEITAGNTYVDLAD